MRDSHFSLSNKTRGTTPRIPFAAIKDAVLGKEYELSVALLPRSEMRRITLERKHKDHASNVLSFPLSKTSGEILLCPETARREAPRYGKTPRKFLAQLFIHALLHLNGLQHSATMERKERAIAKRFGF